ncbi:MAG TPA: cytochrome-c peroxidase [Candidatus Limnocylindria bacterium]|nr:cytochrome-c peroxidase [Candidatus Limnocylindria bacterium]
MAGWMVVLAWAGQAAVALAAEPQVVQAEGVSFPLPLGLQADAAYIPDDNPPTDARVELGRLLYFDKRLSEDNTISCATCHDPAHGFAEPRATSTGIRGQVGARNAPTVLNRLFSKEQFWDGRAADLEEQAHGPIINQIEMGMASHDACVERIKKVAGYAPYFEKAFGTPQITMPRIAQAIASYERRVLTGNSPFDRYQAGDRSAMSEAAVRGMAIFNGKGNCVTCHAGFNFTDESYHNLGVGMNAPKPDLGRFEVTKQDVDRGAFKTPTLRNVTQTAPYMHNGAEKTLRDVVVFYNKGGEANPWLSKEIRPLGLTESEISDLVAFLEALTGEVTERTVPTNFPQ